MPTTTPRLARLLAIAGSALLVLACGGDDDVAADREPAEDVSEDTTTSTTEAEETTTTTEPDDDSTTTTEDDDGGSGSSGDEQPTISRGDAEEAAGREAMDEANTLDGEHLYFNLGDGVECEGPDADQPDNLNERAPEWSCELDHEVNGVRCEGSVTMHAEGEEFEEEVVVDESEMSCERV